MKQTYTLWIRTNRKRDFNEEDSILKKVITMISIPKEDGRTVTGGIIDSCFRKAPTLDLNLQNRYFPAYVFQDTIGFVPDYINLIPVKKYGGLREDTCNQQRKLIH